MILFKILLAPVLIGLVSLAGRRWGPGVAGWLLGLPLNSGPILFFLVIQEGREFTAAAAIGSLLGIIAWATFGLVYSLCCTRFTWWLSTLAGWIAYSGVALLLLPVRLGVGLSFLLVVAALIVLLLAFPRAKEASPPMPHRKYEIWLRMATASLMVVTLTGLAKLLGPMRSGILTAFPAYTTIMAVFNHQQSPASAVRVLRGVTMGLFTAATFFLVLSSCLTHWGAVPSFTLALLAGGAVHAVSLMFVRRSV